MLRFAIPPYTIRRLVIHRIVRHFQIIFFCVLALMNPLLATAEDINVNDNTHTAILGTGYQTNTMNFVGDCITGGNIPAGSSESSFNMSQSLTEDQASDEMGFAVSGRARFGVVEGSAAAKFIQSSVSDKFSISAIWSSYYKFQPSRLTSPVLTLVGQQAQHAGWNNTCGDQYVSEIRRGAKLFFSVRIEFVSEEQKKQFSSSFSIAGPIYGVTSTLDNAAKQFSREVKIQVSAIQFGGDISKLTGIFPNTDNAGRLAYVNCTLGDLTNCAVVLQNALAYATDADKGFPHQLDPSNNMAADLTYHTDPDSNAGVGPDNYPGISEAIQESRNRLSELFEHQFKLIVTADRLLDDGLSANRQDLINAQRDLLDRNKLSILAASKICYDTPDDCPKAVDSLKLEKIDESVFALPDPPIAGFRVLSANEGVWSRDDSVASECVPYPDRPVPITGHLETRWGAIDLPLSTMCQTNSVPLDAKPIAEIGDDISHVLYIQGGDLKDATFMFNDTVLGTIDLNSPERRAKQKSGDNWAILVLKTSRSLPDWVDFDAWEEAKKLSDYTPPATGSMPF
jgi:hypothetical protein